MATGLHKYTVQENVAPYSKAVVATTNDQEECRAVYSLAEEDHVLTVGGVDITFTGMLAGTIYPIAATKCGSANVIFLY